MKEEFAPGGGGISSVKRMALDGGGGERSRISCKRIKTTLVNGFIVYTRTRRTKLTKLNEEEEEEEEDEKAGGSDDIRTSDSLDEKAETNITESSCVKNIVVESSVERTAEEERLVTGSLAETNFAESSCVKNTVVESFVERTAKDEGLVTGSFTETNMAESFCVKNTVVESLVERTAKEERLVTGSLAETNIAESSCVKNTVVESPVERIATEERLVTGSFTEINIAESSCVKNTVVESFVERSAKEERSVTGSLAEIMAGDKFREVDSTASGSSCTLFDVVIDDIQFEELLHEAVPVDILPEGSLGFEVAKDRTMGNPYLAWKANRNGSFKRTKQIYKSFSRLKKVNNLVPKDAEVLAGSELDSEGLDEQNRSMSLAGIPTVVRKRPDTVRELFETGILDGVSVVYTGTAQSQGFGLRGIITDGGILCSCSSCDWANVVTTSQFEIHANKQYKRASQYICFENGKSLLDVLKICRNAPLHSLQAKILDAVDSASKEKCFTCKRCKGVGPFSSFGHRGLLCLSCSEIENSQTSPTAKRTPTSAPACITSLAKSRWKITRKRSESTLKSPLSISPLGNSTQEITRKALRQALVGKALSASTNIASHNNCRSEFKMLAQHSVTPKALKSVPLSASSKKRSCRTTRRDQGLHKLVFEREGLPDGTELGYYARGQKLLGGHKMGAGIYCYCCKCEVSPSVFEAHAGWTSRRKPYFYIYTSNGVSLHEWAMTFSQGRKYSANENDDLCVICADGGNLLRCDSCPRAFHIECVSLPSIPRGNWHCKYCEKNSKSETVGEYNVNASAPGQLEGVDHAEQLAGRCIRVVKNMEAETNGCVLCSGSDFCRSGFGPRTIIICDQCEKEYHIGCLSSHNIVDLKELPKGNWFCSMDCTRINSTLQKLLLGEAENLSDSSLEIIRMKQGRTDVDSVSHLDIRWRLISGKVTSPESRMLLSQALAIFHDCFDPIVDPVSGRNLIPRMVYGKSMQGQDYGGICCAVLTVNETVVSAGLVRVFGREVAELPLVATRICSREKGYFQLLFSCVEKLLAFLNVGSIMVPAAEEAEPFWINKFGFRKLAPEQLSKYVKVSYQMVRFKGASMLQKPVHSHQITDKKTEAEDNFDLKQPKESLKMDERVDA